MVFSEEEENILVTLSMEVVLFLSKAMEIYKSFCSECTHIKLLQLCPTLCNPLDCSPPGSSVHRILQARTRVGCHALLQGIFPTQGLNLCLLYRLHLQMGSLTLATPGKSWASLTHLKNGSFSYKFMSFPGGWGRSPGEGKGYSFQYSGLENSIDSIVHGVAKSQTWLSNFHFT